jgi:hypothetical protein
MTLPAGAGWRPRSTGDDDDPAVAADSSSEAEDCRM